MNELIACPFCEGKVVLAHTNHRSLTNREHMFKCLKCGALTFLQSKPCICGTVEETESEAAELFNCRPAPENKGNPTVILRVMREIKEENCGDHDCLLPESKLDDSGYWADDDASKNCTYGVCYRALEHSLQTSAPENKPLTLLCADSRFFRFKKIRYT